MSKCEDDTAPLTLLEGTGFVVTDWDVTNGDGTAVPGSSKLIQACARSSRIAVAMPLRMKDMDFYKYANSIVVDGEFYDVVQINKGGEVVKWDTVF